VEPTGVSSYFRGRYQVSLEVGRVQSRLGEQESSHELGPFFDRIHVLHLRRRSQFEYEGAREDPR
jgi:hypothetical protein